MKIARHSKILELINQYDIETQEELAARLQAAGFRVTQATVSRDIRELKLMKIAKPGGGSRYKVMTSKENSDSEKYIRVLRDAFLSMDIAQNILVIKTTSGYGQCRCGLLWTIWNFRKLWGVWQETIPLPASAKAQKKPWHL